MDEILSKLAVHMGELIASQYRKEDELKWREILIMIGKNQRRFR